MIHVQLGQWRIAVVLIVVVMGRAERVTVVAVAWPQAPVVGRRLYERQADTSG